MISFDLMFYIKTILDGELQMGNPGIQINQVYITWVL